MSSSQPFEPSSSLSHATIHRRKSRFTHKHLSLLAHSSPSCPLRVIAHIDLDAFYAQCEMVRLGVSAEQPLAVQQWQGLIAINYPARKFGINRHANISEAKKACPDLIMQHVATWKEGEEKWAYHEDAFAHMGSHKVSLDPYRLESRKILATIKETLPPAPVQRVEKASIDEVFVDLSAQIYRILIDRYPELAGPAPYDDPTENLPLPPTTALDWNTDALVDLDADQTEDDDPDWDDITILIGSDIVRGIREAIYNKLKYTCSAGVARNKMIAKLGSGHRKPNAQTVVRNRAVQQFLSGFKFTKIRNLGGKLGDQIVASFGTDSVTELLDVPMEQMSAKIGQDTGNWLYGVIRGDDHSEVNPRTKIKSMLSAKSFRPSINTPDQAMRWLRIFVADIFARLVEEGVVENKRRPKTLNLHHRQGGQTRSRQTPIPQGRAIDESLLFELAKNLLGQVILDGRAWPCANLMLSVGGFEDGVTGNKGIGDFLIVGDEARALMPNRGSAKDSSLAEEGRPSKRRKMDQNDIQRFLKQESTENHEDDFDAAEQTAFEHTAEPNEAPGKGEPERMALHEEVPRHPERRRRPFFAENIPKQPLDPIEDASDAETNDQNLPDGVNGAAHPPEPSTSNQQTLQTYFCVECSNPVPVRAREEHQDWHFAKALMEQEQKSEPKQRRASTPNNARSSNSSTGNNRGPSTRGRKSRGTRAVGRSEKGQSRLTFTQP